ncbi:putative zinc-binding metallopeptidase [Gilvimarinus sp. DA14]|uniref:zinc-binding metallopeptidase family protein n=1 Tax=Gilvimarinus sp. DA14 TaxID=2956798 RepID=UPI0020B76526|nr:putative zinc-binding metallopeptidase [Gilvimarinus sp. DA14]UTF61054.1 putative zinc-binding peptidase [Gilvimarinus sp. DA14]
MKDFYCRCGARVFFRNTQCLNCQRRLGFAPQQMQMLSLDSSEGDSALTSADGTRYRYCKNHYDYGACNWLLHEHDSEPYCLSCRLNDTVPDLSHADNVTQWAKLEAAKRHLIYSLLSMGLNLTPANDKNLRLAFEFLEDSRSNPAVAESFVATGHSLGLITINLAEADDAYREKTRLELGEHYRTILGHFRHEIGHYYYELLVADSPWLDEFCRLFGDPNLDYQQALKAHYQTPVSDNWQQSYISHYAQSHPMEDWAETWAHYLHIVDTLETARSFGLLKGEIDFNSMDSLLAHWLELSVSLNALNRSMGLGDAYPFVITPAISDKLRLVHRIVTSRPN